MPLEQMWKLEIKWLDNDRKEHTTTAYTSFEITDEGAELILEAQGRSFGCSIDNPVTQEITPPMPIE